MINCDQINKKNLIINKIKYINDVIDKQDIDYIIDECKGLEENYKNQYFCDIISELEYKNISIIDDIYIFDDLEKIKLFLKYTL